MRQVELTESLRLQLELADGYRQIREIPGRGICAVQRFMYTSGLVYGIDETGYAGRWCYDTMAEAISAIKAWDGVGDPSGEWIKYKGTGGERSRISDPYED